MKLFLIFTIALALAMDAFAVSVGLSVSQKRLSKNQILRLASGFGLFQLFMSFLGWLAGQTVLDAIKMVDHWVAFGLLAVIGAKMIHESFREKHTISNRKGDPTKGLVLLLLSVATSIDALAVGLSFGALNLPILVPCLIIGFVAFIVTVIGTKVGPLFGRLLGKRGELVGGFVLILIGIKILIDHL